MNEITKFETSYEDFVNENIPERRYKVVYPYKEYFYLTEEERNFLLNQLQQGSKYVQIGEHTFTGGFTMIYPIKAKPKQRDFVIVDGKAVES